MFCIFFIILLLYFFVYLSKEEKIAIGINAETGRAINTSG